MPLRPPRDFDPPLAEPEPPTEQQLHDLWRRHEAERRRREREREWGRVQEGVRRDPAGEPRPASAGPSAHTDGAVLGPHSRAALRPMPREGRVCAAGIDTWSPCWQAEPGSPAARALRALATRPAGRAWVLPEPLGGHRVGWFPDAGLAFAEGRPGGERLATAAQLPEALAELTERIADLGIPLAEAPCAGLRRLDVAADLRVGSAAEGLALLDCVAAASPGPGKLASYRAGRCPESVLLTSRAGRTQARVYDKGTESGRAARGHWLRFEAQWRFQGETRPAPEQIDGAALRQRFRRRFEGLWQAAGGMRLGGLAPLADRLAEALGAGQLLPSRARSLAGYLVLSATGLPQGASRTAAELERECRQLGLSVSLLDDDERRLDVATVLDECFDPGLWR